MENLGKKSGIRDVTITNRIQDTEERIWCVEDKVEEIDTTVKENSKYKNLLTKKHPWNSGYIARTKSRNNWHRGEWRFPPQRTWKCLLKNCRRKLPQPKERDWHKSTRSL